MNTKIKLNTFIVLIKIKVMPMKILFCLIIIESAYFLDIFNAFYKSYFYLFIEKYLDFQEFKEFIAL
jgi:hypothetical protein